MQFHCGSLGISKVRYELDSESYEAMMAYSEEDQISQEKHGDGDSSTSLAPVALKEPRKPHKILSSSTPRNSRRSSSSTQKRRNSSTAKSPHRRSFSTPWSSRRMNTSTPGSSQRRISSAQNSPYSNAPDEVSRSRSPRHMSGSVVGKSDARRVRPGSVYWFVFIWFILVLNIHWSLNGNKIFWIGDHGLLATVWGGSR